MTLHDRIRAIVTANPTDAAVLLPVARLAAWLEEDSDNQVLDCSEGSREPVVDYTVAEVARLFGKRPNTVREWIRQKKLDAYQFFREYRVTRDALERFQKAQRSGREKVSDVQPRLAGRTRTVDMGAWERKRRAG